MIDLRKNFRARTLLSILCVSGEYPSGSLGLIGARKQIDKSVLNMTKNQKIFFTVPSLQPAPSPAAPDIEEMETDYVSGRLLLQKGTIRSGSVRFTREGISLMTVISPVEAEYFKSAGFYTPGSGYPNDRAHVERCHRVAEVTAMMARADIEFRAGFVQPLTQNPQPWAKPCFYAGKMLKSAAYGNFDISTGSRHTGLLITPTDVYVTFNSRGVVMRWTNATEMRTRENLTWIAGRNSAVTRFGSAILFGKRDMVVSWFNRVYTTIEEPGSLSRLYPQTYYCTMDSEGEALLRIISCENWRERMLNFVFGREARSDEDGIDGYRYGKPVVCVADCDICRIAKLKYAPPTDGEYIILCSEGMKEQISVFINSDKVEIRTISVMDIADKFPENKRAAPDG